jgi:hypothetical protein
MENELRLSRSESARGGWLLDAPLGSLEGSRIRLAGPRC